MVGFCEEFSSLIVNSIGEDPIIQVVGDGVTNPFDMIE